ncbi:MAG: ribosome-binding factor A [Chloroflexi bacterium 13_1_40CM_4_68_4]|nr:MAG: ribosome-binding factor A [Chloroflexi bacterium 13_1_40CM_4_68_4]
MTYKRTDRVNTLIRHELQQLIQREVKDPRVGFATVTDVETTPDLRHAKVFVSVMGTDEEANTTITALHAARAFLRHELAGRITMRRIPELEFTRDRTLDRAMRIDQLLREANRGESQ